MLFSAVLPGAGQAYNRKFWKMPIVYAGLGTATYFIIDNTRLYNRFRDEYLVRVNGVGDPNPDLALFSSSQLLSVQETYRRWRDLSYIAAGAVYILQIVDAAVDAHFYDWEKKINEDLTLRVNIHPNLATQSLGLKLSLKL